MLRLAKAALINWKNKASRTPLLLLGARQTGKTYLLEEFGRDEFDAYHRFDFVEEPQLLKLFEEDLSPEKILRELSIYRDKNIFPQRELIVFDEIQECPRALTSLKYFAEKMPDVFVAASGSLLGVGFGDALFPVGKIQRLNLYPMSFMEFLYGTDQHRLADTIKQATPQTPISELIHEKLWDQLKTYFVVGGLPGMINVYKEYSANLRLAFTEVRRAQATLIKDYLFDISKHSGKIKAVKIEAVFNRIPINLARETTGNKKFVFKDVLPNASRYSSLEGPIEWLIKAGLIHKIVICKDAALPLAAAANGNQFKLYMFDVGLLGAMIGLAPATVYSYDYGTYKGYFAENYVLQELIAQYDSAFFSWSRNTSEVEFLWEREGKIVPIEVKASVNTKAKSLGVYQARYNPEKTVLLSGRPMPHSQENVRLQLPLYLASRLDKFVA